MNSKSFLIIAMLMLVLQSAMGQRLRQAFVDLQEGYFLDANEQFGGAVRKKKDLPIANYGLGLLYMDGKYPKHNMKQAFSYFGKAKHFYAKLPAKQAQYYFDNYGISIDTVNSKINELARPEFLRVERLNSASLYRSFAHQYRESELYRAIALHRADSIENVKNHLAQMDEQRAWEYISDPNTDMQMAVTLISRYEKKYKDTPYMRRAQYDSLLLAVRDKIITTDNYRAAQKFNMLFPKLVTSESLCAAIIKDPRMGLAAWQSIINGCNTKAFKHIGKEKKEAMLKACCDFVRTTGEGKDFHILTTTKAERKYLSIIDSAYVNVPFDAKYDRKNEYLFREFIQQAAPHELAYQAVLRIMSPYIHDKDYARAAEILAQYRPLFPQMDGRIEKTIDLLTLSAPVFEDFRKLPQSVNSMDAHSPVLSADFKTLYFAISTRPNNLEYIDYDEQVMLCDYENGQCTNVRPHPRLSNPYWYEDPSAISPDGNTLLYYYKNHMYQIPMFDSSAKGRMADSINMGYGRTSVQTWTPDASFSSDGNVIIFSNNCSSKYVDRMGGYHESNYELFHGGRAGSPDIYVCLKDDNGNWGEVINLGPTINTPFAERSPVLASDMKTLFFSSNGHYGLGGQDLFMSRRLRDDSWTEWSEPINLGRNINTEKSESSMRIASDGKLAFYSSGGNIYSFILPDQLQAEEVSVVSGKILDSKGNALKASISWEDLSNGRLIGTLGNNPETGEFYITLPTGKNYGYTIESDGYFPTSGSLDTKDSQQAVTINSNVKMFSIDEVIDGGISIVLNNVFFETGKYDLKPESHSELIRLARFFDQHGDLRLQISGHTDNVGSREANLRLSESRADAVRQFLLQLGLPESSIEVVGMADSNPIADNSTHEGRARNRRVEFKILK